MSRARRTTLSLRYVVMHPARHFTAPARRPDPGDARKTKGPAPPPPPAWRNVLIVIGVLATVLLLFGPLMSTGPSVITLTYTQFYNDVVSNRVATASID